MSVIVLRVEEMSMIFYLYGSEFLSQSPTPLLREGEMASDGSCFRF